MMKKYILFNFAMMMMLLLPSCGNLSDTSSPTSTKLSTLSNNPTPQPTNTETPTATYLPITPVIQGTPLPESGASISVDNIDRLTLLARWGKGRQGRIEYTPDGRYLVVSATTGLYFYDSGDYSLIHYFDTQAFVNDLAVSPDSQIVAILVPGQLILYQISNWHLVDTIQVSANSVDFSPDGKMLALSIDQEDLQLRDAATGTLLEEFKGIRGVWDVEFSPRGDFVATSGYSGTLWKIDGEITDYVGPYVSGGSTSSVSFSPDGNLLAEGSDYFIHIWRVLENGRLTIYREIDLSSFEYASVYKVAISPDGNLVAATLSRGVYVWDLRTGARVFGIEPESGYLYYTGIAWSVDSNTITATSSAMGVQIWSIKTEKILASLITHTGSYSSIVWSPDGQMLAVGAEEGIAYLFNVNNGEVIQRFGFGYELNSLAFSPNGQFLAIGYGNEIVHIWNLDGTIFITLEGFGYGPSDAIFSTDGSIFAASLREDWQKPEQVRFWDTTDWNVVKTFSIDGVKKYMIDGFILAPDQKSGAMWYVDMVGQHRGFIRIISTSDGAEITTLSPISNNVRYSLDAISYSPDGTRLAALASKLDDPNHHVLVWSTDDWELLYDQNIPVGSRLGFSYHPQDSISWSPDSTLIAVGLRDGRIQLLNSSGGELLTNLTGHNLWATGVSFSPDGRILASTALDGTIMLWGLR